MNLIAVIPHYRHTATLGAVVSALRGFGLPVLVVDDGSGEDCRAAVQAVAGDGVQVVFRPANGGKGSAMKWGMKLAAEQGYSHALQIDADGQHCFADIPKFAAVARRQPESIICGRPVYGGDAPKARLWGRKITDFWNILHTASTDIKEGMLGFRIYPLAAALEVVRSEPVGSRMDFDNEILVRLHWRGIRFVWIDTPVRYGKGGISHFRAWHDNLLISKMHARLFCTMLARRFGRAKGSLKTPPAERHWAEQHERGHRLFLKLTEWMVRRLPLPVMRAATALVCLYFYLTSPAQRRNIRRYQSLLKQQYPAAPLPRRFAVYRQFAAFGEALTDRFAVWQNKIRYADITVEDPDDIYGIVDHPDPAVRGRGRLLICSHLGNIEICRALLGNGHHPYFSLNVLVYSRHAQDFNRALEKAGAHSMNLIQVDSLDAAKMLELAERLDRGEWIAVAADRIPVRGHKTVSVPFLGQNAELPQGAWLMAALLKAQTATCFVLKRQGRYRLMLRDFQAAPAPARGKTREEAIARSARLFAQRLAEHAALEPLQWFNFYDFWGRADKH